MTVFVFANTGDKHFIVKARFLPQRNDWTCVRDILQRLVLAVDMTRWMLSIHQMQICLPHHSAHTCSSCVCSAVLIRGKMAGGGANGSHGGSLDAISLSFLFSVSHKECQSKACGSQVLITASWQYTILSACFNLLIMHCDVVFVVSGCTTRYLSVKQGSDAYIDSPQGQLLIGSCYYCTV